MVRVLKGKQEPHRHQTSVELLASYIAKTKVKIPYLHNTPFGLDLGIADLTVIDNDRIAARTARGLIGPANALRKLGIGIGEEELFYKINTSRRNVWGGVVLLTMSSPRTPFALPQALITNGSLKATTATMSTPFSRSLGRLWI